MTSIGFNRYESLNVLSWEGLTFQQVVGSIKQNTNTSTQSGLFFSAQPLKHYRRTIAPSTNERQSVTIGATMDQPSGAFKSSIPICSTSGNSSVTTDPHISNNSCETDGKNGLGCNASTTNALNRVRSAGMIKKRNYYVNSQQYLQNRDRTFAQNQFNYLDSGNNNAKPGSALAILSNNTYKQNGSGQFNVANNAVIYKPNNAKFGQQGGVSSSSRIERLKYETIQTIAGKYKETYGANSGDYRFSATYSGSNGPLNSTTFGRKNLY